MSEVLRERTGVRKGDLKLKIREKIDARGKKISLRGCGLS